MLVVRSTEPIGYQRVIASVALSKTGEYFMALRPKELSPKMRKISDTLDNAQKKLPELIASTQEWIDLRNVLHKCQKILSKNIPSIYWLKSDERYTDSYGKALTLRSVEEVYTFIDKARANELSTYGYSRSEFDMALGVLGSLIKSGDASRFRVIMFGH